MSIKIGQKIKEKVIESGLTPTTFAKKIHRERTTVYQIYERESIDTDLLILICRVLKYNFFKDLADYIDNTGDKFIKIEPKVITVDDMDAWRSKYYTAIEKINTLNDKYVQLVEQTNSNAEKQMIEVYLTKQNAFQEVVFDVMENRLKETSVEELRALMGNKIAVKLGLI